MKAHCLKHKKCYHFCGICHAISLICKTQEEWLKRRAAEVKRIEEMKI